MFQSGGVNKHRLVVEPEGTECISFRWMMFDLSSETVQGTTLSLESVDYIESSHGLAASMLSVGDRITDHVLKEHLQNTSGLLVDQT